MFYKNNDNNNPALFNQRIRHMPSLFNLGNTLVYTIIAYAAAQVSLGQPATPGNSGFWLRPASSAYAQVETKEGAQLLEDMLYLTHFNDLNISQSEKEEFINNVHSYVVRAKSNDAAGKKLLESVVSETFSEIPEDTLDRKGLASALYTYQGSSSEISQKAKEIAVYLNPSIENTVSAEQQNRGGAVFAEHQNRNDAVSAEQQNRGDAKAAYVPPVIPSNDSSSLLPKFGVPAGNTELEKAREERAREYAAQQQSQPSGYDITIGANGRQFTFRTYNDGRGNKQSQTIIAGPQGVINTSNSNGPGYNSGNTSVVFRGDSRNSGTQSAYDNYYNGPFYSRRSTSIQARDSRFSRTKTRARGIESESVTGSLGDTSMERSTTKTPEGAMNYSRFGSGNTNIETTTFTPAPLPSQTYTGSESNAVSTANISNATNTNSRINSGNASNDWVAQRTKELQEAYTAGNTAAAITHLKDLIHRIDPSDPRKAGLEQLLKSYEEKSKR